MNEQYILHRIDLLENQVRELQRKQEEDIKWKLVVQKWISQNFEFSVYKQLQRPDILNFNYEPPTACELLGRNIHTAPQLHGLFRKQQEEFSRALQIINMNNLNYSNASNCNSALIHPNQHFSNSKSCNPNFCTLKSCSSTIPYFPNPNQNQHVLNLNPNQSSPNQNPFNNLNNPNPNQNFQNQNQNAFNLGLNRNSINPNQNGISSQAQKSGKQQQQRRKSVENQNQPPSKRQLGGTVTSTVVPQAEHMYYPGPFPGHVPTMIIPTQSPNLHPGLHRFPPTTCAPQSFVSPSQPHPSATLHPFSPVANSQSICGSSPEMEAIGMNQCHEQQVSQGNSRGVGLRPGSSSNSNSNSNISPATTVPTNNKATHGATQKEIQTQDPPNFSQFINDISKMCEPSNSNPNQSKYFGGPPLNYGHIRPPVPSVDQFSCNQCQVILPNKDAADLHFESVHSFPSRPSAAINGSAPDYNNYSHNQNRSQGQLQLPSHAQGQASSQLHSSIKNKGAEQLKKRHSSTTLTTPATASVGSMSNVHQSSTSVHPQAPAPNMPASIPVLQPQAALTQSTGEDHGGHHDEASSIKIVCIQSGGKRYVRKTDPTPSLSQSSAPAFTTQHSEEKHRKKRKNVVLDEITLSDDDENEVITSDGVNQNVPYSENTNPAVRMTPGFSDCNESQQNIESRLSGPTQPPKNSTTINSPGIGTAAFSPVANSTLITSQVARSTPPGPGRNRIGSGSPKVSSSQSTTSGQPTPTSAGTVPGIGSVSSTIIPDIAAVEPEPIIVAPEINLYTSSLDLEESSSNSNANLNFNTVEENDLNRTGSGISFGVGHDYQSLSVISSSNMHVFSDSSSPQPQIRIRNFDSFSVLSDHPNTRNNSTDDPLLIQRNGHDSHSVLSCESADNYLAVLDNENDEVEMDMDFKPCVRIL